MGPGLFTHFLNQISGLIKAAELTKLAWKIFKLKLSSIYVNQSFCPIVISKKKKEINFKMFPYMRKILVFKEFVVLNLREDL